MTETIRFGGRTKVVDLPPLTELQEKSYKRFLQREVPVEKRKSIGLEAILRETFPIKNYDGVI